MTKALDELRAEMDSQLRHLGMTDWEVARESASTPLPRRRIRARVACTCSVILDVAALVIQFNGRTAVACGMILAMSGVDTHCVWAGARALSERERDH